MIKNRAKSKKNMKNIESNIKFAHQNIKEYGR